MLEETALKELLLTAAALSFGLSLAVVAFLLICEIFCRRRQKERGEITRASSFEVYPCPLFSVRFRKPLFGETGHTIMNLLAVSPVTGYHQRVDFPFISFTSISDAELKKVYRLKFHCLIFFFPITPAGLQELPVHAAGG